MDWQQAAVIVTIIVLLLGPGYWLWRDVSKRGRNPWVWVTIYALAAVPPTRLRFILVPLVFAAWFVLRDRTFPLARKIGRLVSGGRRRTGM